MIAGANIFGFIMENVIRENFPDSNVSIYEVPQTFLDSNFPHTARNREDFISIIGFVAACGNINPVLKRSSFVMNPKTFALV